MAMKKFLYFVIAALGFGTVSCEESGLRGGNLDAYGTPHVDYRIMARVVDEDGTPIKGVAVVRDENVWGDYAEYSDEQGAFDYTKRSHYGLPNAVRFFDVDGKENGGEFKERVVAVEFTQVKQGEAWYVGAYEANLGDITLERQEAEEDK